MIVELDPVELGKRDGYRPLRPGVEILTLCGDPNEGASTAVLRYAPGAHVPEHEHVGFEHILVLTGSQTDQRGEHLPGTLIINAPGSKHSIASEGGCLVLAIWEKPVRFTE